MLRRLMKLGSLPIGVDLGSGSVKIAQARSWANPSIVASARVPLECNGIAFMGPEDIRALAKQIVQRAHASGLASNRCVIGLDDRLVRTRSVRQPPMSEPEIESAIQIDGRARLGFTSDEPCELGYLLAGPTRQGEQVRDEVILVGCLSQPIETLVMALAEFGMRATAVEPGFVAAGRLFTRSLRRGSDADTTSLVVDIGRTITGVTILRGNKVAFHKSLEIGGASLDEAARQRLGLDEESIIGMRRARLRARPDGAAGTDPKVERAFFESARPIIADLAHEITLCLRYVSVTFRAGRPQHVHLIGGDAREPGLREQVSQAVGADVKVAGIGPGDLDPSWAVAAGLSIRDAEPVSRRKGKGRAGRPTPDALADAGEQPATRRAA